MKTFIARSAAANSRLKNVQRITRTLFFTAALAETAHAQPASWNWNGNQDGNWANPFNWSTNSGGGTSGLPQGYINFPSGATRLINTNNFAAGSAGFQIYFNSGVGAGTNWGNSLTMYDWNTAAPVIENDSANAQIVNFPVVFQPNAANLYGRLEPNAGNLTFGSTLTMNNNNGTGQFRVTMGNSGTKLTLNGALGEANGTGASFALNSAATVVFGAANTYAGDTFVNNGTLVLAANNAVTNTSFVRLGNTSGSSGANLNVNGGITLNAKINVRSGSSGNMIMANSSGTPGAAVIASNLFLDYPVTLYANSGGGNVLSGATLDLKAQTLTVDGPGTNYITGSLTNSTGSGSLVKNNASGLLTLAGTNTYSGATTINAGELVGVSGGSCSNSAVTVASGATNGVGLAAAGTSWACSSLTYNSGTPCADFVFNNIAPSTTVAPIMVLGNLAFNGTPTILVRGTAITNGQYPLIKYAGTLSGTVPAAATFIVPAGLGASVSNNVANKSIDLVVTNGTSVYWAVGNATWDINTTANWKDFGGTSEKYIDGDSVTLDDTASGASPITLSLGSTVTPAGITVNATKSYTISPTSASGLFTGSGPLVKSGTGTLTIGTTNSTFTGTITVNGGSLTYSGAASLGSGTMTLGNATTLNLPSSGNAFPGNPIFVPAGATATINSGALGNGIGGSLSSGDSTAGLSITGTPSFNSSTSRQFDLFTGTVTVNAGATARFSNTSGVNGGTNATFIDNGLIQTRNAGMTIVLGALGGSGTVGPNQSVAGSGTTTYQVGTNNASTTFSGKIVDFGAGAASPTNTALVKLGKGTMTVSGNSTQNGATNGVNITVAGGQWTCTNLTYGAGTEYATFSFGALAPSTTVAPLFVQNNLVINGVLNVSVSGSSTAMALGTYPLIKYTGTQTGFAVTNPLSLPLGVSGIITNDSVNKWVALIVTNVVTPVEIWTAGTGNWDFSSINWTNPLAGMTTNWFDGQLAQFDDTASGAGPFTVTLTANVNPLGVLFTNNTKNYTLTGNNSITGSGSLTKTGNGTLVLLTTNTFSGGTAVSGGTLQGNSATLLGNINNAGTLVFDQAVNGSNNAVISGAGSLTKQNSGTLFLGGNNTYTGQTTVNGGTLGISAGANLGGSPATATPGQITINGAALLATNGAATITLPPNAGITVGASGATVDVASGITLDYPAQPISGTGSLTKNGLGTFETDEGTASSTYTSLTLNAGAIAFNKSSGGLGAGPLTINGGLIRTTGASSRSPNNPAILVNGDFTLGSPTTAAISFANGGAWTLANGNRTITVDTITATITGSIGDGGNNYELIKAGSGTLVLGSADTFGGGILASAGNINLGNSGAAGSGTKVSWSGGTVQVGNGVTITNGFDNGTASTSDLMMDCPAGTGTWSGPVTSSGSGGFRPGTTGGTLVFTGSGGLGNRSMIVVYGTVQFAGNANFSNSGNADCFGRDSGGGGRAANITWMNNATGSFPGFSLGGGKGGGNIVLTVQDSASLSAGTGTVDLHAISTATATSAVNLNGGNFTAGGFAKSQTGVNQTATLDFNGGTLNASQNNASFLPALSGLTAMVSTGGGTLNNGGFNIAVTPPLVHDSTLGATADGGMTFAGAGITTLAGTNSYTGLTMVNNGALLLTGTLGTNAVTVNATLAGTGTVNGATTVNYGGTLSPGLGGVDTSTLNISNTLALAGNAVFNLDRTNTQNANKIAGLSTVTYGGTLTVTNVGPALQAGDTFTLFSATTYAGGFTNVILPALVGNIGWNTNNLAVNGSISVVSLLSVAVAPASTNVTYGTSVTLTANTTGAGLITYQWYDNNTNAISGETNAMLTLTSPAVSVSGNYSVIVSNASGGASSLGTVTITPTNLNITADNDGKFYGQTKTYGPGSVAFMSTGLQNGETIGSVTILASGGTDTNSVPGSYTLTPSAATGGTFTSGNYNVTYNNGTLTVSPATLLVSADNQGRGYGATNPVLTATITGFVNGESLTNSDVAGTQALSTVADTNSVVGTYDITVAQGTLTSTNYTFSFTNGTLTVAPATITVTADNQTMVYGGAVPSLTASYSGFVNGDTAAVISGSPTLSTTADTNSPVGGYTITAATGTLSATNYAFTTENGTLNVTPASLSITANDDSKTYDGNAFSGGNGVMYSGFVNGEDTTVLSGALSYGGTSQGAIDAGSYTIVPSGLSSGNYNITYNNGTLTVSQLVVNVTADGKTKGYGQADPALTYTSSPSLVAGDSFTGSLGRVTGEDVGSYAITQGTLALDSNYVLNYTGANLVIGAANLSITANNDTKTYGQTKAYGAGSVAFMSSGLQNGETIGSVTITASGGTAANDPVGGYNLTPSAATGGTFNPANYNITYYNGTLTVNTLTINVTADGKTKSYGQADPALTYMSSPALVSGDSFSGALSRTAGEGVGSYAINQGTLALDSNYVLNYTGANLVIGAANLSITANNDTKTYGQIKTYGAGSTAFMSSGLQNGETIGTVTITASGGTAATDPAGSYDLTPSAATGGTFTPANYNITYNNGTLTVAQAGTSVGLSSSLNPAGYLAAVSFMATLPSDATGSVVFSTTNGAFSTNALTSGSATSLSLGNLPRGTNVITVSYAGDGNYLGSSNTLAEVVTNHPPVAGNVTEYRLSGSNLTIPLATLLTNVTDADSDTITLTTVGGGSQGAAITSDGTNISYVQGTNANDAFTYTVSDGNGGNATATITVDVYSTGPATAMSPVNGTLSIQFYGFPNTTYVVQTTTDLTQPWTTVSTNVAGIDGAWIYTDTGATNAQQFYRANLP